MVWPVLTNELFSWLLWSWTILSAMYVQFENQL